MQSNNHNDNAMAVITGYGLESAIGNNQTLFASMAAGHSGVRAQADFAQLQLESHHAALLNEFRTNHKARSDQFDFATLFAISAVEQALADAGLSLEQLADKRVALCFGNANSGTDILLEGMTQQDNEKIKQYPAYRQAANVHNHFNLNGPLFCFTSACTASSSAISFGRELLRDNKADIVLAGGSDSLARLVYAGFHSLRSVSAGVCSPYGVDTGLSLGEGAGFVVMETAEAAQQRAANILAQLRGSGSSLDAYHATAPEPEGRGVSRSLSMALADAGVSGTQIDYVNSHGTGTPANDGAELQGIRRALSGEQPMTAQVSSSKSYFGHALGAAGALELISVLAAQRHGCLPATLGVNDVREDCQGYALIRERLAERQVDWFASTNSAFGGHNTSLVLASGGVAHAPKAPASHQRVFIAAHTRIDSQIRTAADKTATSSGLDEAGFSLKAHFPTLYRRRMSCLSQYAIGAAEFALAASGLERETNDPTRCGGYFATALGCSEVQERNYDDLAKLGANNIKSTLFTDTVLNASLGSLAIAHTIRGTAANFSDCGNEGLQALWQAFYDLRADRVERALVVAGEDSSNSSKQIWQAQAVEAADTQQANAAALVMVNESGLTANAQPLAEVVECFTVSTAQGKQLPEMVSLEEVDHVVVAATRQHELQHVQHLLSELCPQAQSVTPLVDNHLCIASQGLKALIQGLDEMSSQTSEAPLCRVLVVSVNAEQIMHGCVLHSVASAPRS
ncbi:hypothetical protein CWB99_05615 [Pseudoalteromonas rubra]|uniref:3-oxoacyl-[acyl-carrier-protein] synthase 1 n=1 Tax=Pseudoalteromonas rubra TaxID=43658 RepID=A0A5S3WPT9_9GAMM|nr:beta-ketoacyl-[acyl-carrier-protein] synthase family protein [Pseudoalteromonas rubra]TMP30812.1 hypothetical protein CWB99_05615 [Pseudoalteromonas rubra]TMP34180.1 hypothetical protein CWC00_08445 [Pseudoalteromonas rubra]